MYIQSCKIDRILLLLDFTWYDMRRNCWALRSALVWTELSTEDSDVRKISHLRNDMFVANLILIGQNGLLYLTDHDANGTVMRITRNFMIQTQHRKILQEIYKIFVSFEVVKLAGQLLVWKNLGVVSDGYFICQEHSLMFRRTMSKKPNYHTSFSSNSQHTSSYMIKTEPESEKTQDE